MAKTLSEKISEGLKKAYLEGRRGKKPMTIARQAYFAGLFDGEGWVGTGRSQFGSYTLRVIIGMTNPVSLYELREIYGGKIYTSDSNPLKWKKQYRWQLGAKTAALFLRDIFPYLRVKKPQAALGLGFYKFYHRTNKVKLKVIRDIGKKKQIAEEIKRYNQRGVIIN